MGQVDLPAIALRALNSGNDREFVAALADQQYPESFGILLDPNLAAAVKAQLTSDGPAHWIQNPLTWNVSEYGASTSLLPAQHLLHLLWQDLGSRLRAKLDSLGRHIALTRHGAVHCFFGRAALSIFVEYRRTSTGVFSLTPIDVRLAPSAVMELVSMLQDATPAIRNAIKRVAHSTDKIVYQCGVICHVHRQLEVDVFGPSIDTVVLAGLLAEWLTAFDSKLRALEIGTGSGLLSAVIAASDKVLALTTIDVNQVAATCALKNLTLNGISLTAMHQIIRVRAESFSTKELLGPFDLVVCNPPYIPDAPVECNPANKEYSRAVGGLELCLDILNNLHLLIGDEGVLLLMVSSISEEEVIAGIPFEYYATRALPGSGRRVPLDVEVVWENPTWREKLVFARRIEEDENGDLWHELRPLWITKRQGSS